MSRYNSANRGRTPLLFLRRVKFRLLEELNEIATEMLIYFPDTHRETNEAQHATAMLVNEFMGLKFDSRFYDPAIERSGYQNPGASNLENFAHVISTEACVETIQIRDLASLLEKKLRRLCLLHSFDYDFAEANYKEINRQFTDKKQVTPLAIRALPLPGETNKIVEAF